MIETPNLSFEERRDYLELRRSLIRGAFFCCPNCDEQMCSNCLHAMDALAAILERIPPRPARLNGDR